MSQHVHSTQQSNTKKKSGHNTLPVLLLSLPGAICWFEWFLSSTEISLGPRLNRFIVDYVSDYLVLYLIAASCTAIISLIIYLRRPWRKPWFVWLNLAVNISGLIFLAYLLIAGDLF